MKNTTEYGTREQSGFSPLDLGIACARDVDIPLSPRMKFSEMELIMSEAVYPDAPPDPSLGPRFRVVDAIWYVIGINFEFAFIDEEVARRYKSSADGFYGLGSVCRLFRADRVKAHGEEADA